MVRLSTILKNFGQQMFKFLLALLSGYMCALGFETSNWVLTILSLAIVIWQLDKNPRRIRIWILLIFSSTFFLIHLSWMKVIGIDAWLLITALGVIPWIFLGLVEVNRRKLSSLLFFAFCVVAVEVLRSHIPFGGFPWGLIAYSQVDGPLVQLARVGSSSLVTFAAVLVAGLILRIFSKKFLSSILLLSFIFIFSSLINPVSTNADISLVAIQGNVPRIGLDLSAQRKAVLNNHLSVTDEFLAKNTNSSRPELIIWPESSTDIDPLQNREVAQQITTLVKKADIPILVGATIRGTNPDGPRNVGILWQKSGPTEIYAKNNLVPFGEYIPFRNLLTDYIDRIQLVPNDYIPGSELGLFKLNRVKSGDANFDEVNFGNVICFEIAFGNFVRQVVNSGAEFLTVQTNNATYGLTQQPEQQFTITRFRAIEHERSIVVASTSGISGAIDPNGKVLIKTDQFVPAIVEVQLPISSTRSISDSFPGWMSLLSCLIVGLNFLRIAMRNRKPEKTS